MAMKSKYMFITPAEFARWLRETSAALDEHLLLYRGPGIVLERWNGAEGDALSSKRVYWVNRSMEEAIVLSADVVPGRLGWVQMDVPCIEGTSMVAIQLAAKSDWLEPSRNEVLENPETLRHFDRVWKEWKSHLRFPVWAKNANTGAEAPYPSIGYSAGAADWFFQGGALRQRGVTNIEFTIRA